MMLAANILLAIVWAVLIGPFSLANLLVGFVAGLAGLAMCSRSGRAYARRFWGITALLAFLAMELVIANIRVAYYTVSRLDRLHPAVLAVPLEELSDIEITLLAILVTLTPGTLTLDLSPDHRIMYIHFMHVEDEKRSINEVKSGFERRIMEALR